MTDFLKLYTTLDKAKNNNTGKLLPVLEKNETDKNCNENLGENESPA